MTGAFFIGRKSGKKGKKSTGEPMLIPVILQVAVALAAHAHLTNLPGADLNAVSSAPKGGDPWMGRIITYLSKPIGICLLAAYLHLELFRVRLFARSFVVVFFYTVFFGCWWDIVVPAIKLMTQNINANFLQRRKRLYLNVTVKVHNCGAHHI